MRSSVSALLPVQEKLARNSSQNRSCFREAHQYPTLCHLTQKGWSDATLIERDELTFAATWLLLAQVTNFGKAQTMVGLKSLSTDPLQGPAQRPGMSRALQLQRRRWLWLVLGAAEHARTFVDRKWVEIGTELPIDVIGPPAPTRFFFPGV